MCSAAGTGSQRFDGHRCFIAEGNGKLVSIQEQCPKQRPFAHRENLHIDLLFTPYDSGPIYSGTLKSIIGKVSIQAIEERQFKRRHSGDGKHEKAIKAGIYYKLDCKMPPVR